MKSKNLITEKPKILMVADTYYPKIDGTLKFMEEFILYNKNDFDISLLVPYFGKKIGKNVHYLKTYKRIQLSGYPSIKFSFQNLKIIKNTIKEADLVFIQGPVLASYLSVYYAWRLNKKVVFFTHTLFWEIFSNFLPLIINKLFFNLVKMKSIYFYNKCDAIFVPYHNLKDQLKKAGVKSKIEVTRLGVDINKFHPLKDKKLAKNKLGIKETKTIIGYVGRVSKEKNVEILLDAFNKLDNQENLFLLIVGDGPKKLINKFKEHKNCKVTGFVKDVAKYLQAMDLFVLPSLTETTSLATLEAMSCGLPVLVTKVGFMKKYVVKDHNGVFFPRNSSTMLAVKIDKLLNNPKLREKLGYNARRTVAYSFSWERSINKIKRKLLEIYNR